MVYICFRNKTTLKGGFITSGEGGIRTHAPLRTNGFQDRLVMTTSIPLLIHLFPEEVVFLSASEILSLSFEYVNTFFEIFLYFFQLVFPIVFNHKIW